MTSDFFVKWFKTQLLPALKTPHIIVMGNASFHPKNILDELCIQDRHFFLPLPPYSPDLNPIEQAWAILKKKLTDLLREVPNIFECLDCFFKTKWLYYHVPVRINTISLFLPLPILISRIRLKTVYPQTVLIRYLTIVRLGTCYWLHW